MDGGDLSGSSDLLGDFLRYGLFNLSGFLDSLLGSGYILIHEPVDTGSTTVRALSVSLLVPERLLALRADGVIERKGDTLSLNLLVKFVELSSREVVEFDEPITIVANLALPEEVVALMELGGALVVKGLKLVDGLLKSGEEILSGLEAVVEGVGDDLEIHAVSKVEGVKLVLGEVTLLLYFNAPSFQLVQLSLEIKSSVVAELMLEVNVFTVKSLVLLLTHKLVPLLILVVLLSHLGKSVLELLELVLERTGVNGILLHEVELLSGEGHVCLVHLDLSLDGFILGLSWEGFNKLDSVLLSGLEIFIFRTATLLSNSIALLEITTELSVALRVDAAVANNKFAEFLLHVHDFMG